MLQEMAQKKKQHKTDWSNFLLITGIVLLIIVFFIGIKKSLSTSPDITATQTYAGTLPCADCSGLDETITLIPSSKDTTKGNYIMHDVYQGKEMKPVVTEGAWIITKGIPNNPQATLLTLDPANPETTTYFLMHGEKSIELLNSDKEKIDSPFNETLTRVTKQEEVMKSGTKSKLANPASVNCEEKGGTLVIQQRGDGGEYGLCQFEDNQACEEWALYRGECPVGGIKTTGYDTTAQKYCAWVGGQTLAVPDATCTLPNGDVCADEALYNGTCN